MWVTQNPCFFLLTNIFGMLVTGMQNELRYGIRNINRDKDMGNRLFVNLFVNDMLKKLQSDFSPDDVSRNLPFWGYLPGGYVDDFVLDTILFSGNRRYQYSNRIGFPYI